MKLAAKKVNEYKTYIGTIPKIAVLIKIHPETIRRWKNEKKYHVFKNGYEITFDLVDLNAKNKVKKP